jgi:hypothetical protein
VVEGAAVDDADAGSRCGGEGVGVDVAPDEFGAVAAVGERSADRRQETAVAAGRVEHPDGPVGGEVRPVADGVDVGQGALDEHLDQVGRRVEGPPPLALCTVAGMRGGLYGGHRSSVR